MSDISNPFFVYGYVGPDYFCDRKEETEEMISALRNGCHLTLVSPRRYGKTCLIRNVFHHIGQTDPNIQCFYVDIYATSTLADFVQMLAKAIMGKEIFFQHQFVRQTIVELFTYIQQSGKQCYIAIDEFQQVLEYPDENVEALLRTYIQKTNNARFIFSGSKQHMMAEMFNSPKHPFYRSTEKIHLDVLDEKVYYEFVSEKLGTKGMLISAELFHQIYSMVDGVTWYVQAIMNRIYRLDLKDVSMDDVNRAIQRIIASEEDDYKKLIHLLTANQASLLKAIAREGIVKEPLSGLFLRTHQLKSTSSVQRALQFLVDEEFVYQDDRGYMVYDRFMSMWLNM